MNECLKLHRISHGFSKRGRPARFLAALFRHLNQALFSCHISSGARIGDGCVFQHNGVGVVVSEYAVIGNGCTIYQHATLGVVGNERQTEAPLLEDGVTVGAGAVILGKVTVGAGAKVGANAVVLHDVPPFATAVGVPARIVKRSKHSSKPAIRDIGTDITSKEKA